MWCIENGHYKSSIGSQPKSIVSILFNKLANLRRYRSSNKHRSLYITFWWLQLNKACLLKNTFQQTRGIDSGKLCNFHLPTDVKRYRWLIVVLYDTQKSKYGWDMQSIFRKIHVGYVTSWRLCMGHTKA